ncbi:MAG: sugar phosphate isomerase/epimerase family protein [Trichloromonadaceae bacterium]
MYKGVHGRLPARLLATELGFYLEQQIAPEIAFSCRELDDLSTAQLLAVGRELAAAELAVTVHAPFHDLNPGALDPLVTAVTRKRIEQTLSAAECLGARLMVVHPGFDRWRYQGLEQLWLEASSRFWQPLLPQAAGQNCLLALENIFDHQPEPLATLLEQLNSPWLVHCFDVGHWQLFSRTPLADWFHRLGPRIAHLHLHDNRGDADAHLPVGAGSIDFGQLFRLVQTLPRHPSMTCEALGHQDLLTSLAAVVRLLP